MFIFVCACIGLIIYLTVFHNKKDTGKGSESPNKLSTISGNCVDKDTENCTFLADPVFDYCSKYKDYMTENCSRSCNFCR